MNEFASDFRGKLSAREKPPFPFVSAVRLTHR